MVEKSSSSADSGSPYMISIPLWLKGILVYPFYFSLYFLCNPFCTYKDIPFFILEVLRCLVFLVVRVVALIVGIKNNRPLISFSL
jgi:hypothetical protein